MASGRTTAAGLWRFASDYAAAGAVVVKASQGKFSHPAYFLYSRAIELALKAFLVARGVSYTELRYRPYGHDLDALMKRARRHRLGQFVKLEVKELRSLSLLNAEYSSKRMEYIVTGSFNVPGMLGVQFFTHALIAALNKYCVEATYGKVRA